MTLIRQTLFPLALLLISTGCAIKSIVSVPPVSIKEENAKVYSTPITIEYLFDREALSFPVAPTGDATIACSFQIDAVHAVYATLDAVNRHSFGNIVGRGTAGAYHIQVKLEMFDVDLIQAKKSFGVTARADAKIVFDVTVFNPSGVELGRRTIQGEGKDEQNLGSCLGGKGPLLKAIQNGLVSMANDYQRRIIRALELPH